MTTLAANKPRPFELGDMGSYPVAASTTIYEGSAVGLIAASGYARPLTSADRFVGFCFAPVVNVTAAELQVQVRRSGAVQLPVTGAVITDVGMPVYATDDDVFTLSPVGGVFIGFIRRWVSSAVAVVEFGPLLVDPYAAWPTREAVANAKTLDAEDSGKLFWVTADAGVITLPAIATALGGCAIVNGGAFGTVLVTVSPAAADMIMGLDLAGVDDKDLLNTKATARRGDLAVLMHGDADGYVITRLVGTWAKEG
ncbi:hypothetical protein [Candidatus Thiodictyon syntrophicum]|uniref:Uncharacterized protein n=1 Tax=Candidatus Thiodictyon syntrophicum TaxID=1166950 RepID=A0A2K8U7C0_9GAMM|nr:hypothetical protein [Candidatus Thiodictyon syntrophicum]AUB81447.1 hypothetical protein THSYN_11110 [Candidatus Thiodictyon syntrophicum]